VTLDHAARLAEVVAWLKLTRSSDLSEAALRTLLSEFGLPEAVLEQSISALSRHITRDQARALRTDPSSELQGVIDTTALWLSRSGRKVVTLADDGYPPLLLHDGAAPAMLFTDGPASLTCPRLALLGPDAASKEAIDTAVAFARELSASGIALLLNFGSSFSAAVLNALLALPQANLLAVLDAGPDRVSRASHIDLARKVAEKGALVTEFAPGERPALGQSRSPRLLMAGLPSAVLVFEAGLGSALLATAQQAGMWGRDLFAVPGSIHSPLARGCHRLIRDGARLVENVHDILEEAGTRLRQ
jgi:DNA processing protein